MPTEAPNPVFVTVGTTSFDALIAATTTPEFANALEKLGFDELRLQVGRGAAPLFDRAGVPLLVRRRGRQGAQQ